MLSFHVEEKQLRLFATRTHTTVVTDTPNGYSDYQNSTCMFSVFINTLEIDSFFGKEMEIVWTAAVAQYSLWIRLDDLYLPEEELELNLYVRSLLIINILR